MQLNPEYANGNLNKIYTMFDFKRYNHSFDNLKNTAI